MIALKKIRLGDVFSTEDSQFLLKNVRESNGFPGENFEHLVNDDVVHCVKFPN